MSAAIEAKNLTVKFGDFIAVNDVSFKVEKGEVFAFLGPNGAGKSTTIRVLTTLLAPSAGEVSLAGESVAKNRLGARRRFGIVFQDPSLDDELTARENMELHARLYGVKGAERDARIGAMLDLVGLSDRANDLVRTYSGGMRRRLEIARSLVHTPEILFLDEPTLGLDPQTRNHMWGYIEKLRQDFGMTIFFTTHYMEEAARNAGRVAIIDGGKIVAEGTPQALVEQAKAESLEDAFIALTGREIREEAASALDGLRRGAQMWGRRR